jgi:polypeptide N-acetylgalactosaminyltransferase
VPATTFAAAAGDSISLDREIPDSRASACVTKHKSYSEDLPQTSVIFVFYNEPLSPLLRSIHSVLNKSPPHLLKEIILIDDGSDKPWTQQPLEDYINLLPKVILKRMGFRQGLMGTREEGARIATAETVTFLDSHIEVNVGWLEPMLARIHEDRRHAVMPIIDSIDPDNFRCASPPPHEL